MIKEVFDEFIKVVEENHKYIIGLIDEHKKIIFCSDKSQIGDSRDYDQPDENNQFYKILVQEHFFGYLWVNGYDNLEMISKLLQESLSVRLLYEINQSRLNRKVTRDDELVKLLLNKEKFDKNRILDLMKELGFNNNKPVVAIYITHSEGFNLKDVMRLKMRPDNKESIYSLLNDQNLLIFKTLSDKCVDTLYFKQYINDYIVSLTNWDINDCYYAVGSIQHDIRKYYFSFKNAKWVKESLHGVKDSPLFFCDYLDSFLLKNIPREYVEDTFCYYIEKAKNIDKKEFVNIAEKLYQNDFNLTKAADSLFLHKNTLIYKLRKYEEVFQLDIRGSFSGKIIFILIANVFKSEIKEIQAGDNL